MKVLAFFAAVVLLSACSAIDRLWSPDGDSRDTSMGSYPLYDDGGDVAMLPDPEDEDLDDRGRYAPAPKAKPRVIATIAPDALVGKSPLEVQAIIGAPVAVADRAPAKIWSYRSTECVVDIFFYLDVGSSTFRALTLDLKDAKGKPTQEPRCLGTIQALKNGS